MSCYRHAIRGANEGWERKVRNFSPTGSRKYYLGLDEVFKHQKCSEQEEKAIISYARGIGYSSLKGRLEKVELVDSHKHENFIAFALEITMDIREWSETWYNIYHIAGIATLQDNDTIFALEFDGPSMAKGRIRKTVNHNIGCRSIERFLDYWVDHDSQKIKKVGIIENSPGHVVVKIVYMRDGISKVCFINKESPESFLQV